MYEIFEELLKKHNVSTYRVSKDTGIGASTFTDWKSGRSKPKNDKLQKIADYFGVSLEYLLTGEEKKEEPKEENPLSKLPEYVTTLEEAKAVNKLLPSFGSEGKQPSDDELIEYINDILDYIRYKNLKLK